MRTWKRPGRQFELDRVARRQGRPHRRPAGQLDDPLAGVSRVGGGRRRGGGAGRMPRRRRDAGAELPRLLQHLRRTQKKVWLSDCSKSPTSKVKVKITTTNEWRDRKSKPSNLENR